MSSAPFPPSNSSPGVSRVKLKSALLAEAAYDSQVRVLDIVYLDAKAYRFYDVPASTWEALIAAPSPGRYFLDTIRERHRRVRLP